jgi:aminotransferase
LEIPVDPAMGYSPRIQSIEDVLSHGCDLIYLESPNQLTGYVYSKEQVEEIARLLEKYNALAVWDQGIAPSVMNGYVPLSKFSPDRTIMIGELWPGLGISTWQIGYVAAPLAYVEGLTAIKQVISICTGTPSQWGYLGGAEAFAEKHPRLLKEISDFKHEILTTYSRDRRIIPGQAESILAIDFGEGINQARKLVQEQNMRVMDGKDFNAPGIIRITMKPDTLTVKLINDLLEGVTL